MSASRKAAGSNVALALANVKRRSGGTWVTATIAKRRSGGTWVDIFAAIVSIADYQSSLDATSPADSTNTYGLNADGTITGPGGNWLTGGSSSDYEVRATQVSDTITGTGTSATGTLNTWMNLGTNREWTVAATGAGNTGRRWVLTIEIRRASDLVVLDSATIDIEATTSSL